MPSPSADSRISHRIQVDDLRLPVSRFTTRVILVLFIMTAKYVEQFNVASFSCCALWLPEDCLDCYGHVNFVFVGVFLFCWLFILLYRNLLEVFRDACYCCFCINEHVKL